MARVRAPFAESLIVAMPKSPTFPARGWYAEMKQRPVHVGFAAPTAVAVLFFWVLH